MSLLGFGCKRNYAYSNAYRSRLSYARHLSKYIGETVIIFTNSGGTSGCGITGVLLSVNPSFLRLVTEIATPPANPLVKSICSDYNTSGKGFAHRTSNRGSYGGNTNRGFNNFSLGSVCDIPLQQIAVFCHNTV